MRLDGQRIVKPEAAALDPAPPLLEHPYAAISFLLALSGSRSSSAREEPFSELDKSAENSSQVFADGVDGKLADLAGDSSRLWSSDSEDEEKVGEGKKRDEPSHVEVGRWQLDGAMSSQNDGLDEDADTREWLQAFESEANSESDRSSAHTDGERLPDAFRRHVLQYRHCPYCSCGFPLLELLVHSFKRSFGTFNL